MLVVATSAREIALAVALGIVLPVVWWAALRCWRGLVTPSSRAGFSPEWQIAHLRVLPLGAVCLTLAFAAVIIDMVWGRHARGADAVFQVARAGALLTAALGIFVRFTCRPRWLIPPWLRPPDRGSRFARSAR